MKDEQTEIETGDGCIGGKPDVTGRSRPGATYFLPSDSLPALSRGRGGLLDMWANWHGERGQPSLVNCAAHTGLPSAVFMLYRKWHFFLSVLVSLCVPKADR